MSEMTRLEEARWLAQQMYKELVSLIGNNVYTDIHDVDEYLKDNDVDWLYQ